MDLGSPFVNSTGSQQLRGKKK